MVPSKKLTDAARQSRGASAHILTPHKTKQSETKRPLTPHAPRPRTENDRDPDPDRAHEARDERRCVQWRDAVPQHAERLEKRHPPTEELGLDGDNYGAEGDDDYDAGEEWEGLRWGCLGSG